MIIDKNITFVAGMPRSSTTFLYFTISKHPDVYVPARKEPDYFSSINHFRGIDWYRSLFEGWKSEQTAFDFTPHYFMDPNSPQLIKAFNPDARVVLIIRTPADWFTSYFFHLKKGYYKKISLEDMLRQGFLLEKEGKSLHFSFDTGSVREQIIRFQENFGENLLLCNFQVIKKNPLPVLKKIEQFVGLKPHFKEDNFTNVKLMSANRKPFRPIHFLKQQKLIIDIAQAILPGKVIYWIQKKILEWSVDNKGQNYQNDVSIDQKKMISSHFQEDQQFINNLFSDADFVLGDGSVF